MWRVWLDFRTRRDRRDTDMRATSLRNEAIFIGGLSSIKLPRSVSFLWLGKIAQNLEVPWSLYFLIIKNNFFSKAGDRRLKHVHRLTKQKMEEGAFCLSLASLAPAPRGHGDRRGLFAAFYRRCLLIPFLVVMRQDFLRFSRIAHRRRWYENSISNLSLWPIIYGILVGHEFLGVPTLCYVITYRFSY